MNNDPLLDTRAYKVEFADRTTGVLTDNIIANNLLAQVNEEVNLQMILDEIIERIQDVNAIGKKYAYTKTPNGMKQRKMTKEGW